LRQIKKEEEELPSLSLVLGFMAVRELGRLEDRVKVLARLGYPNAEIAVICDTTADSVRALKSRTERRSKK
jgi:DNA-binding CsgD family transcriptional regulator